MSSIARNATACYDYAQIDSAQGEALDTTTTIRLIAAGVFLAVFAALIVVAIFYILTLSRALEKCAPQHRTMQPGMTWLLLIPLVNIVWNFFVVLALSESLGNEFRARGIPAPPEPGKGLGLAMCICACVSFIPPAGLAHLILWIIYWVKIAEFSRMLNPPPFIGWPPVNTPGY